MSIDLGMVKTGIAICDITNTLAYPLCVINEKNKKKLKKSIKEIILKENVDKILIGLPIKMNGTFGKSAKLVNNFKEKLNEYLKNNIKDKKFEIILWDERLSTIIAQKRGNESGNNVKKFKNKIDSAAATVILQNYIDFLKNI